MGGCTCPYKSHSGDAIASLQFVDSPSEHPPSVSTPVPPFFGAKSGVIPLTLDSINAILDQTAVIEQWGYKNRGLSPQGYLELLDNGPNQTYRSILKDIVSNKLVDISYKYGYFYAQSSGNFLLLSQVPEMFYSGDLSSGRQHTLLFRRSLVPPFCNIPDYFHPATSLTEPNLAESNLTESSLTESSLTEANLTESNLTESNLTELNLTESNLTESNLTELNLTESNLTEANLTESNLTESNLTEPNPLSHIAGGVFEGTMGNVDVAPLGLFTLGEAASSTLRLLLDSHDYKGYYFYHIVFSNLVVGVRKYIANIIRKDLGLGEGVGATHIFGASQYARSDDLGVISTLLESKTISMSPPRASDSLILRGYSDNRDEDSSSALRVLDNHEFSLSYSQGFIFTHHPESVYLYDD